MISWNSEAQYEYREGFCLSTDEKPTGTKLANGSKLTEIDTGTEYRYDAAGDQWHVQPADGGGGGLSSYFVVSFTMTGMTTATLSSTMEEIDAAFRAGKRIILNGDIGAEVEVVVEVNTFGITDGEIIGFTAIATEFVPGESPSQVYLIQGDNTGAAFNIIS